MYSKQFREKDAQPQPSQADLHRAKILVQNEHNFPCYERINSIQDNRPSSSICSKSHTKKNNNTRSIIGPKNVQTSSKTYSHLLPNASLFYFVGGGPYTSTITTLGSFGSMYVRPGRGADMTGDGAVPRTGVYGLAEFCWLCWAFGGN